MLTDRLRNGIMAPAFILRPELWRMVDEPTTGLSLTDRLIAGILLNIGWIVMLIGLEPVGASLITGSKLSSVWAVIIITVIGLAALVAGLTWPPSNPETRELVASVVEPVSAYSGWIMIGLVSVLWLVNFVPSIQGRQIATIQSDMTRYVLPRHLSEKQVHQISEFLAQHDPKEITIVSPIDEEASQYAGEFWTAFTDGGWKVHRDVSGTYSNRPLPEGLSIDFRGSNGPSSVEPDPKHPNASTLLVRALKEAHVEPESAGSSGVDDGSEHGTLSLGINHRRMDDGVLQSKKREIERLHKLETEQAD